jgi:CDP-diglyceride synthetase
MLGPLQSRTGQSGSGQSGPGQSDTGRRVWGALLFSPLIILFAASATAAQWLLVPFAFVMLWEFCAILKVQYPVRFVLAMNFLLFSIPAPIFTQIEALAGMSLQPVLWTLAGMIVVFVALSTLSKGAQSRLSIGFGLLGMEGGHHIVLILAGMVAACDIMAYFVGRGIGGARLAPAISPNKTRSGAIGGILGSIAAGGVVMYFTEISLLEVVVGGAVIAVLAQVGDLAESALKRGAGVKDSGRIIPGHGGFLDRFDGYLLTLPSVYIYMMAVSSGIVR